MKVNPLEIFQLWSVRELVDFDSYIILLAKMHFITFSRKENAIIGTESDGIRCCFCFSYEEVYLKKS